MSVLRSKIGRKGFTFIELLLTMAIVASISTVIVLNYGQQKPGRDLASVKLKAVSVLREASTKSIGQNQGVSWGVRFQVASPTSSFFALFKDTYSSSNTTIFVPFPSTLRFDTSTFTGNSKDIIFNKLNGKANASTSIRIYVASDPSQYAKISISSSGIVQLKDSGNDPINVALNKFASQVSTGWGGLASRAADGNTDGNFWNGSVAHTNSQNQDWWEVDLGQTYSINTINIWNRTDYCPPNCLSNYYILISSTPFSGSLATILSTPGVWSSLQVSEAGRPTSITAMRSGRYVRVQRSGAGYLQLAEVEVMGR